MTCYAIHLHNDLYQRYFDAVILCLCGMTHARILGLVITLYMQIWHVQFKPITFVPLIVRCKDVLMCTFILIANKHGLQIKIYGRMFSTHWASFFMLKTEDDLIFEHQISKLSVYDGDTWTQYNANPDCVSYKNLLKRSGWYLFYSEFSMWDPQNPQRTP